MKQIKAIALNQARKAGADIPPPKKKVGKGQDSPAHERMEDKAIQQLQRAQQAEKGRRPPARK